jgi:type III secretory pathway component EscS
MFLICLSLKVPFMIAAHFAGHAVHFLQVISALHDRHLSLPIAIGFQSPFMIAAHFPDPDCQMAFDRPWDVISLPSL